MSRTSRNILSSILAVVAAGLVAVPAQAQGNCDWYAKTALRQQQENEQKKCGFKGDGWSSDLRGHLTWCQSNPDKWKSEAQRREQLLAGCKR